MLQGGKQCAFLLREPQVSLVPQLLLNYWERVTRSSASLDQTNRRRRWRPRVPGYIGVHWTTSTACARKQRRQRVLSTSRTSTTSSTWSRRPMTIFERCKPCAKFWRAPRSPSRPPRELSASRWDIQCLSVVRALKTMYQNFRDPGLTPRTPWLRLRSAAYARRLCAWRPRCTERMITVSFRD